MVDLMLHSVGVTWSLHWRESAGLAEVEARAQIERQVVVNYHSRDARALVKHLGNQMKEIDLERYQIRITKT